MAHRGGIRPPQTTRRREPRLVTMLIEISNLVQITFPSTNLSLPLPMCVSECLFIASFSHLPPASASNLSNMADGGWRFSGGVSNAGGTAAPLLPKHAPHRPTSGVGCRRIERIRCTKGRTNGEAERAAENRFTVDRGTGFLYPLQARIKEGLHQPPSF